MTNVVYLQAVLYVLIFLFDNIFKIGKLRTYQESHGEHLVAKTKILQNT